MPCAASSCAVPPVESISTFLAVSARASSTRWLLSETDSRARRTSSDMGFQARRRRVPATRPRLRTSRAGKSELLQFLPQRAAVDAEDPRGAALVALGVVEHHPEQGLLHLA